MNVGFPADAQYAELRTIEDVKADSKRRRRRQFPPDPAEVAAKLEAYWEVPTAQPSAPPRRLRRGARAAGRRHSSMPPEKERRYGRRPPLKRRVELPSLSQAGQGGMGDFSLGAKSLQAQVADRKTSVPRGKPKVLNAAHAKKKPAGLTRNPPDGKPRGLDSRSTTDLLVPQLTPRRDRRGPGMRSSQPAARDVLWKKRASKSALDAPEKTGQASGSLTDRSYFDPSDPLSMRKSLSRSHRKTRRFDNLLGDYQMAKTQALKDIEEAKRRRQLGPGSGGSRGGSPTSNTPKLPPLDRSHSNAEEVAKSKSPHEQQSSRISVSVRVGDEKAKRRRRRQRKPRERESPRDSTDDASGEPVEEAAKTKRQKKRVSKMPNNDEGTSDGSSDSLDAEADPKHPKRSRRRRRRKSKSAASSPSDESGDDGDTEAKSSTVPKLRLKTTSSSEKEESDGEAENDGHQEQQQQRKRRPKKQPPPADSTKSGRKSKTRPKGKRGTKTESVKRGAMRKSPLPLDPPGEPSTWPSHATGDDSDGESVQEETLDEDTGSAIEKHAMREQVQQSKNIDQSETKGDEDTTETQNPIPSETTSSKSEEKDARRRIDNNVGDDHGDASPDAQSDDRSPGDDRPKTPLAPRQSALAISCSKTQICLADGLVIEPEDGVYLNERQVKQLCTLFDFVDRDKTGELYKYEAVAFNKKLEKQCAGLDADSDADLFFDICDRRGEGIVSREDWILAWNKVAQHGNPLYFRRLVDTYLSVTDDPSPDKESNSKCDCVSDMAQPYSLDDEIEANRKILEASRK